MHGLSQEQTRILRAQLQEQNCPLPEGKTLTDVMVALTHTVRKIQAANPSELDEMKVQARAYEATRKREKLLKETHEQNTQAQLTRIREKQKELKESLEKAEKQLTEYILPAQAVRVANILTDLQKLNALSDSVILLKDADAELLAAWKAKADTLKKEFSDFSMPNDSKNVTTRKRNKDDIVAFEKRVKEALDAYVLANYTMTTMTKEEALGLAAIAANPAATSRYTFGAARLVTEHFDKIDENDTVTPQFQFAIREKDHSTVVGCVCFTVKETRCRFMYFWLTDPHRKRRVMTWGLKEALRRVEAMRKVNSVVTILHPRSWDEDRAAKKILGQNDFERSGFHSQMMGADVYERVFDPEGTP